jgi:hypothetical protein
LFAKANSGVLIVLGLGWVCLTFAGVTASIVAWQVIQQYRLLRLPLATGTMLRCEPLLTRTPTMHTSMNTPSSASMWIVEVRYRYSVNGTSYESNTFSQRQVSKIVNFANPGDPAPASIAELCRRYSTGSSVRVHYHPDAPQKSFLYFNPPWQDWIWALIPILAAGVGWLLLFAARFAKR